MTTKTRRPLYVSALLIPYLFVRAALGTLGFPLGVICGCGMIGFVAGVEFAERNWRDEPRQKRATE